MNRLVENKPFDKLRIGDTECLCRTVSRADVQNFVTFAGDIMEDTVDRELAADADFRAALSAGGMAPALLVALVAGRFPGPGTRLRRLTIETDHPIRQGDAVIAEIRVIDLDEVTRSVTLACTCTREDGTPVVTGQIEVVAPENEMSRPFGRPVALGADATPDRFERIEEMGREAGPIRMAVVNPVDVPSLQGALDSAAAGLIEPVLIAPRNQLLKVADEGELVLSNAEIIDVPNARAAAEKAADLAAQGTCAALMKGKIHTDALLRAVLEVSALRTDRRLSHVFVEDLPGYPRLLFVADAAVNIAPDLLVLRDIVQNTIDLARALGVDRPKVALLSAVETVTPDIPSTINAAAICKMADRGEIVGADIDGPLAMDNAVSEQAARIKGITSKVAGRADILIAPDLEAANILAKDLDYLAGAEAAGITLGARIPIALTSRADTARERRASAAIAAVLAARNRDEDGEQA